MRGGSGSRGLTRRRRAVWISVGAVGLVLLGALAWLGYQVLTVRTEVTRAQDAITALRGGGDIGDNLHQLAASGAAASRAASDPVWALAEHVPVAGDNLRAVRIAAQTLDELSNGVALPVLDAMKGGNGSLSALITPLQAAQPKVDALAAELDELPTQNLIAQVRDGIGQVKSVMKLAAPAVRFLPGLLGADGPKNYLVVAQNNAELMPLGGSAASSTLVRIDNGRLAIVKQASSQDFHYDTPLPNHVARSALWLYGEVMRTHINATVSRPDWPTAAGLITTLWHRDISKDRIDGVVSLDPIALSYFLKATGSVTMPDGETLTSDNIVKVALSDAYAKYGDTPDHGNTYFKVVAASVFQRVAGGDYDPKAMLLAAQEAIGNRSLMFWSADPDLQSFVASTRLGGVLPHSNKTNTSIGVFFRDHSFGTKIDYYLKPSTSVRTSCGADGTTTYTVTVQVKLDISAEAEAKLPDYVRAHLPGHRYDTEVFVYGPRNATLVSYKVDNRSVMHRGPRYQDLKRPTIGLKLSTKPTQSAKVEVTFAVAPDAGPLGPTQVLATPTVHPVAVSLDGQACPVVR